MRHPAAAARERAHPRPVPVDGPQGARPEVPRQALPRERPAEGAPRDVPAGRRVARRPAAAERELRPGARAREELGPPLPRPVPRRARRAGWPFQRDPVRAGLRPDGHRPARGPPRGRGRRSTRSRTSPATPSPAGRRVRALGTLRARRARPVRAAARAGRVAKRARHEAPSPSGSRGARRGSCADLPRPSRRRRDRARPCTSPRPICATSSRSCRSSSRCGPRITYLQRNMANKVTYQLVEAGRGESVGAIRRGRDPPRELGRGDVHPRRARARERRAGLASSSPDHLVTIKARVDGAASRSRNLGVDDEIVLHVPVRGYLRFLPAIFQGEGPGPRAGGRPRPLDRARSGGAGASCPRSRASDLDPDEDPLRRAMFVFQHVMTTLSRAASITSPTSPTR